MACAGLQRGRRGFLLVDLLVSLFLGVLLSVALVSSYLAFKRHYLHTQQLERLQENGRHALRLLTRELSMAGFYGGLVDTAALAPRSVTGDCDGGPWALDAAAPLGLVNDHAGGAAPLGVDGTAYDCVDGTDVVAGTDLLAIKRSFAAPSVLRGVVDPALTAGDTPTWYLRLHAGAAADWRQHSASQLAGVAQPQDSYWQASARVFFVRDHSNDPGAALPTLCMEALAGQGMRTQCLVEGVEDLQVTLGVDTNGDGRTDRYLAAPAGQDLARAVSARVEVLLRALEPVPGHVDTGAYRLGGRVRQPARDAYPRRVYAASVRLHNLAGEP
ncbi:MAG: hypothetical protein CME59_07095 [Halioglobus sp.]|nr:hypothetical protein [Halioglobus sp.]